MQDPEIQNILTDPVMRQVQYYSSPPFSLTLDIVLRCSFSCVTFVWIGPD